MANSKIVFITGGSKGLGKEIASLLLKENCEIINFSRSSLHLENVLTVNVDFSKPLEIKLSRNLPRPDALIINTGMFYGLPLYNYSSQKMIQMVNVNINGNILILSKLLKRFNKIDKIIIISSTAASKGHPDILYGISKAALHNTYISMCHLYKESKLYLLELGQISGTMFTSRLSDREKSYLAEHIIRTGDKLAKGKVADVVKELVLKSNLPNAIITMGDTNSWKQ